MDLTQKMMFCRLLTLYGVFRDEVRPYIDQTQGADARMWADKVDRSMIGLFGKVNYYRTEQDRQEIRRFMDHARLFIEHPEIEAAWQKAEDNSLAYALSLLRKGDKHEPVDVPPVLVPDGADR